MPENRNKPNLVSIYLNCSYQSIYLSIYLSQYLYSYLSLFQSIYLSIYLSITVSLFLSIWLFCHVLYTTQKIKDKSFDNQKVSYIEVSIWRNLLLFYFLPDDYFPIKKISTCLWVPVKKGKVLLKYLIKLKKRRKKTIITSWTIWNRTSKYWNQRLNRILSFLISERIQLDLKWCQLN